MHHFNCILETKNENSVLYYESDASTVESQIHLGGLFNSLYPFDLKKILSELQLSFHCKVPQDDFTVEIYLHYNKSDKKILTTSHSEITSIPQFEIEPGQRITAKVSCAQGQVITLKHAGWNISNAQIQEVRLGIVICTHNNAELLTENIQKLFNSTIWNTENIDLIIVNNGQTLPELKEFESERIHLFQQENLGGSGGFGKGMYEFAYSSLSKLDKTHILLMDDDVLFHPEILHRTITLYSFSRDPSICIGGAMLKLEDPTFLHEAGNYIRENKSLGHKTQITRGRLEETDALHELGRAHTVDYNAWWYCSFPIHAVRKIGLPLPLFIHGDDIEYGSRLTQNGYQNICPAGVALWHSGFENKAQTWIKYFDHRNALIRAILSPGGKHKNVLRRAKVLFSMGILRNDYGSCIMLITALKDFRQGGEAIEKKGFDTLIDSLSTIFSQYSKHPSTGRYRMASRPSASTKPHLWDYSKLYNYNLHFFPLPSVKKHIVTNRRFSWWNIPYLADIEIHIEGSILFYPRNRRVALKLKKEFKKELNSLKKELPDLSANWEAAQHKLSSPQFWKEYTSNE